MEEKKIPSNLYTKHGLIYRDYKVIPVPEADHVAHEYGFENAERLVQALVVRKRKPHLSASSLRMYEDCGEQYRRRYIENEKIPPGIAMIRGSSVDDSVTENLQSVISSGRMLNREHALTIGEESIKNRMNNEEVLFSEEEVAEGIKTVKANAIDSVVNLSKLHYDEVAETLNPSHVQLRWILELTGFPFDLLGYMDVVEQFFTDDKLALIALTVRDTKVSGKSPNGDAADISEQLTMYAMAAWKKWGIIPKVFLDFLTETPKTKERKYVPKESTRTKSDFQAVMNRLEAMANGIEKEVFMPCSSDHWRCSTKWCGYASSCRYFSRR